MNRSLFFWPLISFTVAILTALYYRCAFVCGTPINAEYVRHAHSHLMFFGFAVPLVFSWWASRSEVTISRSLFAMQLFAFLSFIAFLYRGYDLTQIGSASLPLSAILSSGNVITWYFSMYFIGSKKSKCLLRTFAGTLLWIGTVAVWLLPLSVILNAEIFPGRQFYAHLFLTALEEGFLFLSVLAILIKRFNLSVSKTEIVLLGSTSLFLTAFAWNRNSLSEPVLLVSILGIVLHSAVQIAVAARAVRAAITYNRKPLKVNFLRFPRVVYSEINLKFFQNFEKLETSNNFVWLLPVIFLFVKAAAELLAAIFPAVWTLSSGGARFLYLHAFFLGIFLPILLAESKNFLQKRNAYMAIAGALLVLLSFVPLSPFSRFLGPLPLLPSAFVFALAGALLLWETYRSSIKGSEGR